MSTGHELRDDFEDWVNDPLKLKRVIKPGYTDEYEQPWTRGAWAAWKACHERAKPSAPEVPYITMEQWENAVRGLGTK